MKPPVSPDPLPKPLVSPDPLPEPGATVFRCLPVEAVTGPAPVSCPRRPAFAEDAVAAVPPAVCAGIAIPACPRAAFAEVAAAACPPAADREGVAEPVSPPAGETSFAPVDPFSPAPEALTTVIGCDDPFPIRCRA